MRRRAPSPPTSLPRHQALVVNRDTATTAVATIATTAFALLESPLRPEPALARCGGLWDVRKRVEQRRELRVATGGSSACFSRLARRACPFLVSTHRS